MIYLRSFKLFESYYDTLDDVQNLISEVEDRLDCDFKRNIIDFDFDKMSFIFTFSQSKNRSNIDDKLFQSTISWFIDSIKRLGKIIIRHHGHSQIEDKVFSPEFGTFYRDEFTNGSNPKGFVINISGSFTEIFTNLIRDYNIDPQSIKKEIENFGSDKFIHKLFKLYCGGLKRIDFTMLEVFRTGNNDLLSPIKFDDVQLPFRRHWPPGTSPSISTTPNSHDRFIIDITPIFLEKVYKNSGLVFRISLSSKHQFNMVTKEDGWIAESRMKVVSIAKKTDKKLKELGLELTWEDIFVKSENYNNW